MSNARKGSAESRSGSKDDVREASLELFPEREGKKKRVGPISSFLYGDPVRQKLQCEKNVMKAIEEAPMVKLMIAALRSNGCEIDYGRHLTCESCSPDVTGGYDPSSNQLVICYNRCNKYTTRGVLAHELLHMWDVCRANLDFNNLEHVACTEIRAANLMHCSITSGMFAGSVSLFDLKKSHQKCVKQKAVASLVAVRPNSDRRKMWQIVDKVFDKCYNDLEPIGRRVRRNSDDPERAYRERYHYGYY